MIPRHLQYILRITLVQTVQNANKSVSPVIRSQGNVPNVGVLCTESTAISPVQYMICNHKTGACNGCKNGFKGKHCEQKTASFIVSPGADNTSSSDKTTSVPSKMKSRETTKDGSNVDPIILWSMLVILATLVANVIILFFHRKG